MCYTMTLLYIGISVYRCICILVMLLSFVVRNFRRWIAIVMVDMVVAAPMMMMVATNSRFIASPLPPCEQDVVVLSIVSVGQLIYTTISRIMVIQ